MSMKKHLLTLALGLLMTTGAFAQVEFVDADGNVIPNGSTVVRNTIETPLDLPVGKNQQINSGISAKNTSNAAVSVKCQMDVTDIPFGQVALCFPGTCWVNIGDFTGTYPTHKPTQANLAADGPWTSPTAGALAAGASGSLQTEWVISRLQVVQWDGSIGGFTATYSLLVNDQKVSTIKVYYTTDQNASGIAGVKANDSKKTIVACYNAAGQQVSASHKGLTLVKYADGTTKKVVIK